MPCEPCGVDQGCWSVQVHVAASSLKPQSLKSALQGRESDQDDADDASDEYVVEDPYNPQAGASSDDEISAGEGEGSGSDEEEELSEDDEEAGSDSEDEEDEMDVDG